MKWIKCLVYLVIVLLLLQVIKKWVILQGGGSAFGIATVLYALQFLFAIGFGMVWIFFKAIILLKISSRKAYFIALTSVIFVLALLEWISGYLLDHPQHIPNRLLWPYRYYYDRYDTKIIQFQEYAATYDPSLFYRLKPSDSFYYANREFSNIFITNSRGLRDDEVSLVAPQVIMLGDSYGMGWGVEQQDTYAQYLEKRTGLKVLNAAISSYGTAREMKLLQQLDTSRLQHLVIQYCGNDRGENLSFVNSDYKMSISSRNRYDSMVSAGKKSHFYFPGKYFLLIGQIFLKNEINKFAPLFDQKASRDELFTDEKKQAESFVKVLSHSSLNFEKVRVIVVVLDYYPAMKNNFLTELEAISNQSPYKERFAGNLKLVDLSDTLTSNDYYLLDLHIKKSGHIKTAEKIFQAMQQP